MSVDHFSPRSSAVSEKDPLFLHVKAGMTVVVSEGEDSGWEMIWMEGGARDPRVPTLFQIACVDTGTVRWVNADLVSHIVPRVRGLGVFSTVQSVENSLYVFFAEIRWYDWVLHGFYTL